MTIDEVRPFIFYLFRKKAKLKTRLYLCMDEYRRLTRKDFLDTLPPAVFLLATLNTEEGTIVCWF